VTSNEEGGSPSWRELAVARSLDPARVRAEKRVQRFLDAALELMNNSPTGKEFTVQEVVERSGQSLRSFYQYFGGKHELLLALFEEAVRSTAATLRDRIDRERDPLDRLRAFVVEYYRLCRPVGTSRAAKNRPTPAMAEFAQQLLTAHPEEAARAFAPIVALFEEVYGEASTAGVVRADLPSRRTAGVVLEVIMFNAFSAIIGGSPGERDGDAGAQLWDLLFQGLTARNERQTGASSRR
jgi:AcrR family transcriptional regulator